MIADFPARLSGKTFGSRAVPRLGIIGNPENRRVRNFQETLEALGHPRPPCLSYAEILADPAALDRFDVDRLRIDSPGENEAVAHRLIALGGGPTQPQLAHGEIAFLAEYHRGYCKVLQWIEHRGLPCLNAPAEIAVMFDKLACHERFLKHGVNRPEATRAPDSFPALLEYIEARRHGQIFLKPLHGSSASGVCALRWKPGRAQLIAPIRPAADGERTILVNSLNVRTYVTWVDIEQILTPLLPQGMILEPWIPKLTLPDGAVDLRVLVIAGEPRHWVVRQSWHPMTNLHLGNRRADPQSFQNELGPEKLEAIFALATRAAACFPQSLVAGVDVIVDARHRAYVGEINAFGDLLPQLEHRGDTAYTAVARAAMAQIHLGSNPGACLSATSIGPSVPSIPIEQTSIP